MEYQEYFERERKRIKGLKVADIILKPNDKSCLFILGMLFANGVKIKIQNEDELDLTQTGKSFTMMPYVWSRLGDNNFPNKNYSNVHNEMDERIENIKRLGVGVKKFYNHPQKNRIFLICPVRNATPEQKEWIENYVLERSTKGYQIHAPHLHTRQQDLFGGYAICTQNAEATAAANEIDIYYDQESTGSIFDLGVAYFLQKPLVLLNRDEITFRDHDPIDQMIAHWPKGMDAEEFEQEETKQLIKSLKESSEKAERFMKSFNK